MDDLNLYLMAWVNHIIGTTCLCVSPDSCHRSSGFNINDNIGRCRRIWSTVALSIVNRTSYERERQVKITKAV
jgi:hypothetical protein